MFEIIAEWNRKKEILTNLHHSNTVKKIEKQFSAFIEIGNENQIKFIIFFLCSQTSKFVIYTKHKPN